MAGEKAMYSRNGKKYDHLCSADIACGDVLVLDSGIVGVAEVGGKTGDLIAVTVEGVFKFNTDGAAITAGAPVYLKTNGTVSATGTGNTFIGTAWCAAAATTGATVEVAINKGSAAS